MLEVIFKKYILKPISIVIAVLFAVWCCIGALPEKNESYTKFICSIVFWFVAILIYSVGVYCVNKLPKASKKQLGVLFVFHAETEELFEDVKFNMHENFLNISNMFKIPLVPICINVNQIKNYSNGNKTFMTKLLKTTNCIFCVDVLYQSDDAKARNNYELKLNIGTLHPTFTDEESKILIGELNRVSTPVSNLKFNKDRKLEVLSVTATHLHLAAKYIISLVFILSGNFVFSNKLLEDLYSFVCGEENWFVDAVKKAFFNSCIGLEMINLEEYHRTGDMIYIDTAEKYLEKMNMLFPNTYGYNLDMAMIDFVKYRNISSAKKRIVNCKNIGVSDNWKYSDAFLSAYLNEDITLIIKKYEDAIKINYNIVDIIEFIENVLVDEPDKYILHLSLAILYNKFGDKKLTAIHLTSFTDNYKISNKEKYLLRKIEQLRDDACKICKYTNCEKCNKIA